MSIEAMCGTGKLYEAGSEQVVALVNYWIWEKPRNENGSGQWGGELTVDRVIWPSGEYIIELDDGRKGSCHIDIEQSVAGCPVNYRYGLKANGELTSGKELA